MDLEGEERSAALDEGHLWSGLRELYDSMSPRRRSQFYLVLALMIAGAFAEIATIGAVLPFLSLLADPSRMDQWPAVAAGFTALGAVTPHERLVAALALFIVLAVVGAAVRLLLLASTQKFVFGMGHDLAVEIHRRLLFQPYTYHINHNTSGLVASLEKVGVIVFSVLQQAMLAGTSAFMAAVIIGGLIYIDPFTALTAAAAISLIYLLVTAVGRKALARNSDILGSSYDERIKIFQESLGGIRDVIIDSSQAVYVDAFRKVDHRFNVARAKISFISSAPRFVIEALGMVLIAALAAIISGGQGGFARALPILGALALGAQRLLPLLQQVYVGWSNVAGHSSVLSQVLELLRLPVDKEPSVQAVAPLPLRRSISVQDMSFRYLNRRAPAIDDLSFDIPAGQMVALIGKTGSGKSTLADLLMGLIEPSAGCITVDGVPLTRENRRRWQQSIAHVPQAIFLADTSIARNIALGVPADRVDMDRVEEASRKALLDEFVSTLPEGYSTFVGERGIRLSGGQRQRLGIARAIYKHAPVLVLDEATSALDDATEAAVMEALDRLGEEGRTIIMIAHRLSTISRADQVVRLDDGKLAEIGSYAEIVGGTPHSRVL
jgi:ABC-type multidrug transport system fused ATPase/permease subunit